MSPISIETTYFHSHLFETVQRSQKRQAVLVFLLDFAACGNRKELRLRMKGVPPVNDTPECRKQRSECRVMQQSHLASKVGE